MDYILACVLKHHETSLHKVISYDIACQWSKNMDYRLSKLPRAVRVMDIGTHEEVIPKLHSLAHKVPCPADRSVNYMPGAGRTDGKGIEQTHAASGPLCAATKQMGPGYRHDAMDAQWNFWNWRKIVGLGECVLAWRAICARDRVT